MVKQKNARSPWIQDTLELHLEIQATVDPSAHQTQWVKNFADIADAQETRIRNLVHQADARITKQFENFVKSLKNTLNASIDEESAILMLSQHLIINSVIDALFKDDDFATRNPVFIVMDTMAKALQGKGLAVESEKLTTFYESVRISARGADDAQSQQQLLTELYEQFLKLEFPKQANVLETFCTPTEVIDFILRAADEVSRVEFGRGLTHKGVHILDPFTGTGAFITRLLQSGILSNHDMARKYASELHANEFMLPAYYIAAVNIEATYHELTGEAYQQFEGIVFTDTFQMSENGGTPNTSMFTANRDRAVTQLESPINIIVGHPPYSATQISAKKTDAKLSYKNLDEAIKQTYMAQSTAARKRGYSDSYIRAIRWATDRLGDSGVIAYVTQGGWIDSITADGLRLTLSDEFSSLYVFNLRGNTQRSNKVGQSEKNIFGRGGHTTVVILVAVKNPVHTGDCTIHYRDIGGNLTRKEKLEIVEISQLDTCDWTLLKPNHYGDWLNMRTDDFKKFPVLGGKENIIGATSVFDTYSAGVRTPRKRWFYNFSNAELAQNIKLVIDAYNSPHDRSVETTDIPHAKINPNDVVGFDARRLGWVQRNKQNAACGNQIYYSADMVRVGAYTPFCRQHLYFDPKLKFKDMSYSKTDFFPTPQNKNYGFYCVGRGSTTPFSVLMVDAPPDLHHVTGFGAGGQFFPRWIYEPVGTSRKRLEIEGNTSAANKRDYLKLDNITDAILADYRMSYGLNVSKDEIFYYVYGLLHSPHYRTTYAPDLTKVLPRLPRVVAVEDFQSFVAAGHQLSELHLGYETVDPYPLIEVVKNGAPDNPVELYKVEKMRFRSEKDRSALVYNSWITLEGIPAKAYEYLLGSRSGLEWVIGAYQVTYDKSSGTLNDPNNWAAEHDNPRYIINLIKSVTTVSLRTVELISQLPKLTVQVP